MKNEKDKLDQMFTDLTNQWDIKENNNNHKERFLEKLTASKSKKKYLLTIAIAASIALLFSLSLLHSPQEKATDFKFASKETKQTDSIFTVIIEKELEKIKEKKSPENERIINDALKQMKILDKDYAKIIQELEVNGENKQIINALISNLQIRISFLQDVLKRIENTENKRKIPDEKII